jgi:hypothetical protein
VKKIRSDNGSEFKNLQVKEYCNTLNLGV